jgi:PIN domain nuclease of toxin-antitoxin system
MKRMWMPSVLLDTWTFKQAFFPDGEEISERAQKAIDEARAEKQIFVSVLSCVSLRPQIRRDKLEEWFKALPFLGIQVDDVDKFVVVSLDKIPVGPTLIQRLIAATALCRGRILITATRGVECDDLEMIYARPPEMFGGPTK